MWASLKSLTFMQIEHFAPTRERNAQNRKRVTTKKSLSVKECRYLQEHYRGSSHLHNPYKKRVIPSMCSIWIPKMQLQPTKMITSPNRMEPFTQAKTLQLKLH